MGILHHNLIILYLCFAILSNCSMSQREDPALRQALLNFYIKLSNGVPPADPINFGWGNSSKPYCSGTWSGVDCFNNQTVRRFALENFQLNGTFDVKSICAVRSLVSVSIKNNNINGEIPDDFSGCKHITHLYLSNNKFSGQLPNSLSELSNLKKIEIFNNNLAGPIPEGLGKISGLLVFLAQYNDLSGEIPPFNFGNLQEFNISYNNFSGPVPDQISATSVVGNSLLCGTVLGKPCPTQETPSPPQETPSPKSKSKFKSFEKVLMCLGYVLLGIVILSFILYKLSRRKTARKNVPRVNRKEENLVARDANLNNTSSIPSTDYKASTSRPENSITISNESQSMVSTSLVIVSMSPVSGLRFEDLLKAPAELLGRGKHSSVYKVLMEDGSNLAVKRIKDWPISSEEFQRRMEMIIQAKHNNVLSPVAYYGSNEEKLVVYEYQPYGSLLKLLQGAQNGTTLDWGSRLNVASKIAGALAYMHGELFQEGIPHGNLKSSNIMMYTSMDACISEYGLIQISDKASLSNSDSIQNMGMDSSQIQPSDPFKSDVYKLGVVLLELVTGKSVQSSGFDLARWVNSVVREEWTVEVFDKVLMAGGANQQRMVDLLQVALDCIKPLAEARPNMTDVAANINAIKEEDERSMASEG